MKKGPPGGLKLKLAASQPSPEKTAPPEESKPLEDSAIVELEPQIFISSYAGAKNWSSIEGNNISHIFNCSPKNCQDLFKEKPGFGYTDMDIGDNADQDLLAFIGPFLKKLEELKAQKKNVLIHCYKGISRAPSMYLGYLISKGASYEESFENLKKKYNRVDPNFGFIMQLQKLAEKK